MSSKSDMINTRKYRCDLCFNNCILFSHNDKEQYLKIIKHIFNNKLDVNEINCTTSNQLLHSTKCPKCCSISCIWDSSYFL